MQPPCAAVWCHQGPWGGSVESAEKALRRGEGGGRLRLIGGQNKDQQKIERIAWDGNRKIAGFGGGTRESHPGTEHWAELGPDRVGGGVQSQEGTTTPRN
jgi:hypothetical protein